jgi:hypothetical protein
MSNPSLTTVPGTEFLNAGTGGQIRHSYFAKFCLIWQNTREFAGKIQ